MVVDGVVEPPSPTAGETGGIDVDVGRFGSGRAVYLLDVVVNARELNRGAAFWTCRAC